MVLCEVPEFFPPNKFYPLAVFWERQKSLGPFLTSSAYLTSPCYVPWWGRTSGAPAGATLWPPTGPRGAVQVRWLTGRLVGDCSKLAVGRLLMLSRDAGIFNVLTWHLCLGSVCLHRLLSAWRRMSGNILYFSYCQQMLQRNQTKQDWSMCQLLPLLLKSDRAHSWSSIDPHFPPN